MLRVQIACRVVWLRNLQHLSVKACVSRDIQTGEMLGDVVATHVDIRMDS